jgi:hypothetical protein
MDEFHKKFVEYTEKDTIVSRLLYLFSILALLFTMLLLGPIYVIFGSKASEALGRPALYLAIFIIGVLIVFVGMGILGRL